MTIGQRIEARRIALNIESQSELARRVPMGQSTLSGLIRKPYRWSPYLPKIARALRTTVEYLSGETDDPDAGAPALPPSQSVLANTLNDLHPRDRAALLRLATSLAGRPPASSEVALPSPAALTVAFHTYLDHSRGLSTDELARDLAMQLPMILRAAGDGVVDQVSEPVGSGDVLPTAADDERRPVRRGRRS